MLTLATTAFTAAAAIVAMVVMRMPVVEMVVVVGVRVVVAVGVAMRVGMSDTIVDVFMGMTMFVIVAVIADVILVNMHIENSFDFFFIITEKDIFVNKKENRLLPFKAKM